MNLEQRLADDVDSAFRDLVNAHGDLVYGVALRVVASPADADDVAQESFVRAYGALRRYPAQRIRELRLRPWLARIALNQARNHVRRTPPAEALDGAPEPPARADDEPLSLLERSEERRTWSRLLGGLPERYRLAVALRHVDGLSYAELADSLGRPVGSVKSDVHRGVQLLRAAWDAEQRAGSVREAIS